MGIAASFCYWALRRDQSNQLAVRSKIGYWATDEYHDDFYPHAC